MAEIVRIVEVYSKVVELAVELGVENIKDLPGAWEHRINEHWRLVVNGRDEKVKATGGWLGPYCLAIWYDDWLVVLTSPAEGMIALVEEQEVLDLLEGEIERAQRRRRPDRADDVPDEGGSDG